MTLGLAAPASATTYTLTSDESSISIGEFAVLTTDAPVGTGAYVYVNGESYIGGPLSSTTPFAWENVSPCVTVDVTIRVYPPTPISGPPSAPPTFADPYAASVDIEFIGDNFSGCNPTWGAGAPTGSDESLATTGSDASTVAGLTGVAVARRSRRAQR